MIIGDKLDMDRVLLNIKDNLDEMVDAHVLHSYRLGNVVDFGIEIYIQPIKPAEEIVIDFAVDI